MRAIGRHDHVAGIDAVLLLQAASQRCPARAFAPPVKARVQGIAAYRFDLYIQKPMGAQFQHHLRHAAGQKHLHGSEVARAVGQRVHQARNQAIDLDPI